MRTRRRQIAEEKAAKTAVKLIFPLVLFIFPGIFVVLVGPAGIKMYREMFLDEVARMTAARGGLGLADSLAKKLQSETRGAEERPVEEDERP